MHAVKEAFATELEPAQAEELGFHMADWGSDAAFVVALHLFPERFTPEEIGAATFDVALHVPYHLTRAADILGLSENDDDKPREQPGNKD